MSCGAWCVYYRDKPIGICKNCSNYEDGSRPRFELGKIDPFKLAEGLAKKQEKERRSKIPRLSVCPSCHKFSLFYNSIEDRFECLNIKCAWHKTLILSKMPEYRAILLAIRKQ